MTFKQLYSGSDGNLYIVTANNGKQLLIECGVTWKKLVQALDHDLHNIEGCLLSHEHADHSKSVKDVITSGINIFASSGTFAALGFGITNRRCLIMGDDVKGTTDTFQFTSYSINHDAAEPLLFIVKADDEYLLFATDTSHITQAFGHKFNIIAIECSYDKDTLERKVKAGTIHEIVAKRLLTSHLEKQDCMTYLNEFCDLTKCHEIHLLHISGDNNDRQLCKKDFENEFKFIDIGVVE